MNPAPRIVLTALTLFALAACSPSPAQPPAGADRTALQGHAAPVARQAIVRAEPTAEPTAIPLAPTAEPTAEPTAIPLAPTAEPTAEPTAIPLAPTAEPTPEPTAEPYGRQAITAPQRIIIESIALDRVLVSVGLDSGNTPVVPDHDAAWYSRSASPGAGENVVLWGHALRFGGTPDVPAPFERVKDARVGDTITVVTADGAPHSYVIREQIWATPDQVRYILPTGDERLTLVNCIGDYVVDASGQVVSMTHRLITIAEPIR